MLSSALAAEPDPWLQGLPADQVVLVRGPESWSLVVGGKPLLVPAPRTPAEEVALRALVLSLLSGLDLVPAAPLPPPLPVPVPVPPPVPVIVVIPAPPPPPPPVPVPPPAAEPPAPVLAPSPPAAEPPAPSRSSWAPWIGAELVIRPQVSPGAGLAVGVRAGQRAGVGVRLSGRAPRSVITGGESHLLEGTGDLELWGSVRSWVAWGVGVGGAARLYSLPDTLLGTHTVPHATAQAWLPVDSGPVTLMLGVGAEVDLVSTKIGQAGHQEPLPPTALRVETRILAR
jgi:hypothetical protein